MTNHYPRSFGEEEEKSHDSPLPLEYCAPEENSKVPYPRLHESSYLIYDTAFIPDRWGKFDKPTRDKGKCLFYQDPTRALTYVFDMNGKQTSHIRVPLVRPHAQKKYLKIPASELNAFQGTSPKADKNVDSKPLLKTMLYRRQKGLCPSCGETLLSKKTTLETLKKSLQMHSLVVDATRPQTRAYLVHPTKECREPWRRISLEEEYNLHRDLPQVTFLRELMLRQKVCFAKRKEFKYFPKKNNPDLWDSSQFSHFFSHLGDPGDYYRYVAVLLPDKFYWSMKKKKNLSLPSEGIYAASHHCQSAYPELYQRYIKTHQHGWRFAVLPNFFNHSSRKDSIELRDAFSLLELGDEMAYAAVQKRFNLAVHERSIHHRYRREGTDSEEGFYWAAVGFLKFYVSLLNDHQGIIPKHYS